ncbi:MAG: hypothetical protein R3B06_03295 [Kofleriaceae bacterium]
MRDYILEVVPGGVTYLCGQDGRLYSEAQVVADEELAAQGDHAARLRLARVDFGMHRDGSPRPSAETREAIAACKRAWISGAFDRLDELPAETSLDGEGSGGSAEPRPRPRYDRRMGTLLSVADPAVAASYGIGPDAVPCDVVAVLEAALAAGIGGIRR